jgi:hypothetical protein
VDKYPDLVLGGTVVGEGETMQLYVPSLQVSLVGVQTDQKRFAVSPVSLAFINVSVFGSEREPFPDADQKLKPSLPPPSFFPLPILLEA